MSTHVLLNLLNELRKRDKMCGLTSILFFFHTRETISLHFSSSVHRDIALRE